MNAFSRWRRGRGARLAVVFALALIAYGNSFDAAFHFDDFRNIVTNPAVARPELILSEEGQNLPPDTRQEFWLRPIGFLTFALNYKIGGLDTFGFHVFNFLVHCANAALIYFLVLALFKALAKREKEDAAPDPNAEWTALAVSLLFALHPAQTQAVTYIVQRFASLATFFYLASVFFYLKAREKETGRAVVYSLSLLCAVLAVKTKENAYTLPLAITLVEVVFFTGPLRRRALFPIPFYGLLVLLPLSLSDPAGALARGKVLTDMSRWDYLMTQFPVICFYFRLLFCPYGQNLDHDFPLRTEFFDIGVLAPLAVLTITLALAIVGLIKTSGGRGDRKIRLAAFGVLWFFVTISAESGLVPIVDVVYEHRIYLPSFGFFLTVVTMALVAMSWPRWEAITVKRIQVALLVAVSAVLIVVTRHRNEVWKTEISLWEDCARKSPNKPRVLNTLGSVYCDALRAAEARPVLLKTLRIDPENWAAHHNLSVSYELMSKNARARGDDPQFVLNLWGLSELRADAAKRIREKKPEGNAELVKLLEDIAKVEANVARRLGDEEK